MSRPFIYELPLTPDEVFAIVDALKSKEAAGINPLESESFNYAKAKVTALWQYVQAEQSANEAEALYKETLEKDRDAFKVDAF